MSGEKKHALLSPSAAHRWLNCPPSARLCEKREDKSSSYAEAGTEAHMLAEFKLRKYLRQEVNDPTPMLVYYDKAMEDAADEYVNYCIEEHRRLSQKSEALIIIEQRVHYDEYVPHGSGSADCLIIGNGEMVVIDLKFGMGLPVYADNNPQLRLYGLGCLLAYDGVYDISAIKMCVVQPRLENISEETIPKESLYQWAESVVKPQAALAWDGDGEQCAGDWCRFCAIRAECRTRANANLELARLDFKEPPLLENDEIASVLEKAAEFKRWLTDVEKFALIKAINSERFPGFKLVSGRSNRVYTDEQAVAERLLKAGYRAIYKTPELLGLTEMTKLVGKAAFGELLEGAVKDKNGEPTYAPLVVKPRGKLTLVAVSDKRKEITVNCAEDFIDEFDDAENYEEVI